MRILLFANGHLSDPEAVRARIRPTDRILCADGGTRHALALGLTPDLVVGDLDSLDAADIEHLRAQNISIEQFPADKDATDLELALERARRWGASDVLVLGALGGRLDQEIANLTLLAGPAGEGVRLSLADGATTAWIVRDRIVVAGCPGDTLSTLALSPEVRGLTYHQGLRWPLRDFTLAFGSSRGVSNEMTAERAEISLRSGVLLVVHLPQAQNSPTRGAS